MKGKEGFKKMKKKMPNYKNKVMKKNKIQIPEAKMANSKQKMD